MSALAQRLEHGLNETRILILGAQVLLVFGFAATLMDGFERLPEAAMVPPALGLAAELAVVVRRITDSAPLAAAGAALTLLLFLTCWFGVGAGGSRRAAARRGRRAA